MDTQEPGRVDIILAQKISMSSKSGKGLVERGFNIIFYKGVEKREEDIISKIFLPPEAINNLIEYLNRAKEDNSSLFPSPETKKE